MQTLACCVFAVLCLCRRTWCVVTRRRTQATGTCCQSVSRSRCGTLYDECSAYDASHTLAGYCTCIQTCGKCRLWGAVPAVVVATRDRGVSHFMAPHAAVGVCLRSHGCSLLMQLNDTHPTIAVPELMRILMDENKLGWTLSWQICTKVGLSHMVGWRAAASHSLPALHLGALCGV